MKYLFLIIILSSIFGCGAEQEARALTANIDDEKIWVFAQFNVKTGTDELKPYYYYAQIAKSTYQGISKNKLEKGFILLENVKYWGDNDLIYNHADGENTGEMVFRIEDITKIAVVKIEPVAGMGVDQFDSLLEGAEVAEPEINANKTLHSGD